MSVRIPSTPVPKKRDIPTDTVLYSDIYALITNNDEMGEIFNAAMVVERNEIVWVGRQTELPADIKVDRSFSMENMIVSQ